MPNAVGPNRSIRFLVASGIAILAAGNAMAQDEENGNAGREQRLPR